MKREGIQFIVLWSLRSFLSLLWKWSSKTVFSYLLKTSSYVWMCIMGTSKSRSAPWSVVLLVSKMSLILSIKTRILWKYCIFLLCCMLLYKLIYSQNRRVIKWSSKVKRAGGKQFCCPSSLPVMHMIKSFCWFLICKWCIYLTVSRYTLQTVLFNPLS